MDIEMANECVVERSYNDKQSIDLIKIDELVNKLKDKINNPTIKLNMIHPIEKREKDFSNYWNYHKKPRWHRDNRRKLGE